MPYKGRRQIDTSRPVYEPKCVRGEVIPADEYGPYIKDEIYLHTMMGEHLDQICTRENFPSKATIMRWLRKDAQFKEEFIECQRIAILDDAAKMQWIADGNAKVQIERVSIDEDGEEVTTFLEVQEDVQRSALRVKTIQWRASRLLPKVFGDRIQNDHNFEKTESLLDLLKSADNAGHNLPKPN